MQNRLLFTAYGSLKVVGDNTGLGTYIETRIAGHYKHSFNFQLYLNNH